MKNRKSKLQFWGCFLKGDCFVIKQPTKKQFEDPRQWIPCVPVVTDYYDKKPAKSHWFDVSNWVQSYGLTPDIADQGIDYLKNGGKQLTFNPCENYIIKGRSKKIIQGDKRTALTRKEALSTLRSIHNELKAEGATKVNMKNRVW
jgi:hypothetical protein